MSSDVNKFLRELGELQQKYDVVIDGKIRVRKGGNDVVGFLEVLTGAEDFRAEDFREEWDKPLEALGSEQV